MLVSSLIGVRLVGIPVAMLINRTREIGRGNFSRMLDFKRNDEISELAKEINVMSNLLEKSRTKLFNEVKRREKTLKQLRHIDRLATVGKLSSGIAHELGTPLNVVSGRASMIASGDYNEDHVRKFAGIIIDQTSNMTKIIQRLLEFSRKEPLQKSYSDIGRLYNNVLEVLEPFAKKQNIRLLKLKKNPVEKANIDAIQIKQVFTNIVMNSIQAIQNGGEVAAEMDIIREKHPEHPDENYKEYIRMNIIDNGQGMSADILRQIFDPFFTTKEAGKGTGLGLSLANGIIKEHEGWIDVRSELNKGTKFSIYIPFEDV